MPVLAPSRHGWKLAGAATSDFDNILGIVHTESEANINLQLKTKQQPLSVLLTVAPIDRPKGFVLIRGQERH